MEKYQHEPTSSTTFEVDSRLNTLPSLTLCPFNIQDMASRDDNYTLADMQSVFGMDVASIALG